MSPLSHLSTQHILLADDDQDDCLLFEDALGELPLSVQLTTVHNGEQLMQFLNTNALPDVLFLDLNMPRKNGFECLSEIKRNKKLKRLPVIIFSTSFEPDIVNLLYKNGAQYYICKPNEYTQLLKVIYRAVTTTSQLLPIRQAGDFAQPPKEEFVLSPESCYNEK